MIIGIGVDMIEVDRLERAVARNKRFLERIFTEGERAYCEKRKNKYQSYAARFSAKEAAMKALGRRFPWRSIEVRNEPSGKPVLVLHGKAHDAARALGCKEGNVHLSLTHLRGNAMAFVILG